MAHLGPSDHGARHQHLPGRELAERRARAHRRLAGRRREQQLLELPEKIPVVRLSLGPRRRSARGPRRSKRRSNRPVSGRMKPRGGRRGGGAGSG